MTAKRKTTKKGKVPRPSPINREIRLIVTSFYDLQDMRIRLGLRMGSLSKAYEIPKEKAAELHAMISEHVVRAEENIGDRVRKFVRPIPVYQLWIEPHVAGIGELLAGSIVAGIGGVGIENISTVSKLWTLCGQGLNAQGEIQKRVRGQRINYVPFLKRTCWKIGEQFLKIGDRGFYGRMYKTYKDREQVKCRRLGLKIIPQEEIYQMKEDIVETQGIRKFKKGDRSHAARDYLKTIPLPGYISEGQVHNRSKRRAVKLFLSHLWVVWREIEGLPVSDPWFVVASRDLQVLEQVVAQRFLDHKPSAEELAESLNWSVERVQSLLDLQKNLPRVEHEYYPPPGWGEEEQAAAAD